MKIGSLFPYRFERVPYGLLGFWLSCLLLAAFGWLSGLGDRSSTPDAGTVEDAGTLTIRADDDVKFDGPTSLMIYGDDLCGSDSRGTIEVQRPDGGDWDSALPVGFVGTMATPVCEMACYNRWHDTDRHKRTMASLRDCLVDKCGNVLVEFKEMAPDAGPPRDCGWFYFGGDQ